MQWVIKDGGDADVFVGIINNGSFRYRNLNSYKSTVLRMDQNSGTKGECKLYQERYINYIIYVFVLFLNFEGDTSML